MYTPLSLPPTQSNRQPMTSSAMPHYWNPDEERLVAEHCSQVMYGVTLNGERLFAPSGPRLLHQFPHFAQHHDLSDAALPECSAHAPQMIWYLDKATEGDEIYARTCSEWHAEWVQAERRQQHWTPTMCEDGHRTPSVLTQPANIDMATHEKKAKEVTLSYWASDEEAPEGARIQHEKARWMNLARAAMCRIKPDPQTATL
ncbi:hypothetical protein BU23DRAFT_575760 [Bimuria novae-zelandiae CBS 107.79]|uniref:Uncharacterized protein n=1 Tax=Bimuria novae-zelandiae CBS 107.79 TaxID=1447943 RepID=A0A6A5UGK6_9PLEO|nr:hypothetical protein BU23DRAFT_575760 [Bimuria novae-zelandiae CBS 107.79]